MRYLEESFCFQKKDSLEFGDRRENYNFNAKKYGYEVDSDFYNSPSSECEATHKSNTEHMIRLNAIVSSENYVWGKKGGHNIGISDSAMILILMTTDWSKRDSAVSNAAKTVCKKMGLIGRIKKGISFSHTYECRHIALK